MDSRTRLRRAVVAVLLAAALVAVAAGCGGSGSAAGGDGDTGAKAQDAALEWAECMRENGVDMPDPQVDSKGRLVITPGSSPPPQDDAAFRRASEACRDLMRKALPDPGSISKEEQARMRDAALAFTRCMREQGVDMPDPRTSEGDVSVPLRPDDPAFQRAAKVCEGKLPLPGGGP